MFLLRLRYVDQNSSLAELIIKQHPQFKDTDTKFINAILNGEENYKVLLIFDGYDEYKPGTNKDIDNAIENSIGNCFLILTSRPDLPSRKGQYVPEHIREKMHAEVMIEGFSEENIRLCSTQYLRSKEKSEEMISEAKETSIHDLLKIPIVLLMICVLYAEEGFLPKTKTDTYDKIIDLLIDRTVLKSFQPGMHADIKEFIDELLVALGELSWNALQKDVNQLLLEKVNHCNDKIKYDKYSLMFTALKTFLIIYFFLFSYFTGGSREEISSSFEVAFTL